MKAILIIFLVSIGIPKALADQSQRRYGVMFSPVGLLDGILGGQGQFNLSDHWVTGFEGNWYEFSIQTRTTSAWELGFSASYYFERALETGWFIEVAPILQRVMVHRLNTLRDNDFIDSEIVRTVAEYGWTWNSGFRAACGAGFSMNFNRSVGQLFMEPVLRLQLGYTF